MSERKILINNLTRKFNEERVKQMWQLETRQTRKHQSRQNVSLETRNRFVPLQYTQDEVLDQEF